MSFWMSFSIATVLQPNIVFAFGKIDLRVGLGVPHQASQTPSFEIAALSGRPPTNGLRSNVQNSAALTKICG
jgi:hypothetical protein